MISSYLNLLLLASLESIRSLRKKRGDQRPLRQPKAIVSPPKFGPDDQSSSSSSLEDEDELKTPNAEKASSFTVIKRNFSHKTSDVERTAKMGEMNSVANEFSGTGPARVRWADMIEVVRLNLAAGLTREQRSLQEVSSTCSISLFLTFARFFRFLRGVITGKAICDAFLNPCRQL